MLDKNYYPAKGNIIRDNLVLRSGRADIVVSGPGSSGNCLSGNNALVVAPLGLRTLHRCGGLNLPFKL